MNDAAIDLLAMDHQMIAEHPQVDAENGVLYLTGAALAMNG